MMVMKTKASIITGIIAETLSVPGISLSLVCLKALNSDVNGAKLPIPKVSKK